MNDIEQPTAVPPGQANTQFAVLAGCYVAALVAPTLTLWAVKYVQIRSRLLALGVMGVVAIVVGASTVSVAGDNEGLLSWLNTGWLSWLFPVAGILPVIAYHFSLIEVFATLFVEGASIPVTSLVASIAFVLGIVAAFVGEIALRAARNQIACSATRAEDLTIKWSAKWPRSHKLNILVIVVLAGIGLLAVLAVTVAPVSVVFTGPFVLVLVLVTRMFLSEREFELTLAGLSYARSGTLYTHRQFLPWSEIESFTLSDDAVILHREGLLPSIRFSRSDIRPDEEEILAALEEHVSSNPDSSPQGNRRF
ncbi:hypothetical protein [Natrinema versiforme]|uniref:PH domain-containing protein n=1 Tax=Natrinema versiforme TaxID=88724 RepID=A0A4P8WN55_9EURY|nr:hypothetical protein [Natrinema versiforme]QCS44795.1 hypothetical protein FEJ81_21025 [Natrinema versiforme]